MTIYIEVLLTLWCLPSGILIKQCDAQIPNDGLRQWHMMAFLKQISLKFSSFTAPIRHLILVQKG